MKKIVVILSVLCLLTGCSQKTESELPVPEVSEGQRGTLGIDKNINEENIDDYLDRSDSVYYDMRMLNDPADYEAIGGSSILTGYIKGFTVVPYPYLCEVTGLPEEVGKGYTGKSLYSVKVIGDETEYVANYEESLSVIEQIFPRDKNIFLMCGGGGYAGMTKNLLVALGYDETKIYNIGGYWYYSGANSCEVDCKNGICDYGDMKYLDIDFGYLTPVETESEDQGNIVKITSEELSVKEKECSYFMLYVYTPGCASCEAFRKILNEYLELNGLTVYSISSTDLQMCETEAQKCIKYAPSIVVYSNGEIVDYLDAASEDDRAYYMTVDDFAEWMSDKTEDYCKKQSGTCSDYCPIVEK